MSEVKLNLVDPQQILCGTIHGSVADACVAALSAEPETIAELEAALARYIKPNDEVGAFASFRPGSEIDTQLWDAGIVIIDLAARIVSAESSYSQPQREGRVRYHDGTESTDIAVSYRVPEDWEFFNSLAEYESSHVGRGKERAANPPLDARNVLYGRALLEFIVTNVRQTSVCREVAAEDTKDSEEQLVNANDAIQEALAAEASAIHARWLMTPLEGLRGQSPRDVLLARHEFIDFDLHTRELQWSLQGEGPPCLARDSFAYRFAGFGTHECVTYYDLVRHLIWSALTCHRLGNGDLSAVTVSAPPPVGDFDIDRIDAEILRLEEIKTVWLENPQRDFNGRTPANIIENERRRLPLALSRREMIIDDDCYTCVMMANDPSMGPGFWHLDGCNMDDDFAFSFFRTREEWDEENLRREEFSREFDRKWEEREQRLARGEPEDQVDNDLFPDSEVTFQSEDDDLPESHDEGIDSNDEDETPVEF